MRMLYLVIMFVITIMIFLDATDCIKGELEDPNVLHLA